MVQLNNLKKFWKGKKVFITGHTGFKGSWLIVILNLLGAKIYGYSLKPKKKSLFNQINGPKLIEKNFYHNINNIEKLKSKINLVKPSIIFHLAAQPLVIESYKKTLSTFKTNIIGTGNLLEILKKTKSVKSVVLVTTDKVYKIKKNKDYFLESDELGGDDPYSASKACSEIIVNSYIKSFYDHSHLRHRVSTVRSGNVIGGGDYSRYRLVPDIISSINNRKKLFVRSPDSVRPWQHVIEPLVGYIILAQKQSITKINYQPCWNFGPDPKNFVKVCNFLKIINESERVKFKVLKKNQYLETKTLKLSNQKAKKNLKWKPKWDIKKIIEKVFEWNRLKKQKVNIRKICEIQVKKYFT
tara:strand:- start:397 stop:1461 length:1065 start_codon:yes stop_codon:yes gene_type:complete